MSVSHQMHIVLTNSLKLQSANFLYDSKSFDKVIAAILAFSKQEVPKSNIEAIFEYTIDVKTGQLTVCQLYPNISWLTMY